MLTLDCDCLLAGTVAVGISRCATIDAAVLGGNITDDHTMRIGLNFKYGRD